MDESDSGREILVRSLAGESVRVAIEPNRTVQDLKIRLKQCFSPASSSPNFHLFHKGVKLNLQSPITSSLYGNEEFLVFVPFLKKGRQERDRLEASRAPCDGALETELTDSAWSELMQDVSSFREVSDSEKESQAESQAGLMSRIIENEKACNSRSSARLMKSKKVSGKRKVKVDSCDALLSILHTPCDHMFDEQNLKNLLEFVDSSSCLSDPDTGSCIMSEANNLLDRESNPCESTLCLCPLSVKDIMRTFSFINVYSACLQLWQKRVTVSALKVAMDKLCKLCFGSGFMDLELLSEFCPQVIHVDDELEVAKLCDTLVIIKCSPGKYDEEEDQLITAVKTLPRSKIMSSMRKRETSLKAMLCKAMKSLMVQNEADRVKFLSLDDLLVFMKKADTSAAESDVKQGRRYPAAASSNSYVQCHVNQIFTDFPVAALSALGLCSFYEAYDATMDYFVLSSNETKALAPEEMVCHLQRGLGSRGQVVHIEEISARNANYVEIPHWLSVEVKSALNHAGINRLYSHQAESIQASLGGKNVVVATMTSSGKSLCYNIPVLEVLSHDPLACALYLFPTKALAQDQLRGLLVLTHELDKSLNIGIYDGDTSQEDRFWLRDNARLLITNPDMLHVSILPFHGQFRRFLSNLRFIIIDEAHCYKGAFGCHVSLIFRRLRRICAHVYCSEPSFVFSTATSANPKEHAMAFEKELANLPTAELIKNDGSPSGSKLFVLWNPPLCLKTVWKRKRTNLEGKMSSNKDVVTGRSSPILEVSYLFAEMAQHGLRSIVFCKTRRLCELVLCYTREILHETAPHLVDRISSYRGGYIAEDRRRIENDLFNGIICGIAATNALELGIDVGHIDVTLHLGFPGSIASLWQQAGRSGRRERQSLAIYVAFEGPLDQYFMKCPTKLFKGPIECCHVDPNNDQVLLQQLSCAAFEHPLNLVHDEKYFGPQLEAAIVNLKNKGCLSTDMSGDFAARIWNYVGDEKSPSSAVSVRAIETMRYKVIEETKNEVLEEIEERKAFFQVYEGAVYMNQGKTYLVKHLDLSSKIAWCKQADLKYYTRTRDYTDIHVIGGKIAYPARMTDDQFARTSARTETCRITTTWFGFRRIWRKSNQVFDTVELSLPDFSYESQAVWIRVPQSAKIDVETSHYDFRAGLHAAGHALLSVLPLFIICNQSDLAAECSNPHDNRYIPERILLYDTHPGGTGISRKVQPLFTEMLTAALELLSSCHCSGDTGCPNCIQSIACHEYNEVLHKDAAVIIIKGVLDAEKSKLQKD